MDKIYISADELLIDSFKLAKKIYESGFQPQFIVGVWRGGAPVERRGGKTSLHGDVVMVVKETDDFMGMVTWAGHHD